MAPRAAVSVPGPQAPQAAADCSGVEGQGGVGPGDGGAVLRRQPAAAGSAGQGLGLEESVRAAHRGQGARRGLAGQALPSRLLPPSLERPCRPSAPGCS